MDIREDIAAQILSSTAPEASPGKTALPLPADGSTGSGGQAELEQLRRANQELSRLRDHYRQLYDRAPAGNFLLAEDGTIQNVNRAGCEQLGLSLERLRGRRFSLYLEDTSRTNFEVFLRRVFGMPGRQRVELQLLWPPEGQPLHMLMDAVSCPSRSGDQDKRYLQAVLTDISTLKQAQQHISALNATLEARVEARTAQLRELNSELESFVQTVTHELQDPLRQATSLAEVLRGSHNLTPEKAEHFSQVMLGRVDRMNVLLDALGAYFRLGRQRAKFIPVSLDRVLSDVKKELKPQLLACTGRLVWKQEPLPTVTGDSRSLQIIFLNLLDNALKFSRGRDPIQIRILAQETESEHHIGVQDNGVGFNVRHKDRLYDIFKRLHSDREFEGLGLGLPLVRRAVLRHGGRVWCESREGEGSTFWVALPKNAAVNL